MPTKVGTKKCGTCSFMRLENRSVGYCLTLAMARGPLRHGCDKHTPFMTIQCACGCGQETEMNPLTKKPSQFVLGHNSRCEVAKEAHARTHKGKTWHKGIKHSDTDLKNISNGIAAAWERKGATGYRGVEGKQRIVDATRQRRLGSKHTEYTKKIISEKGKQSWEQVKADPEKFAERKQLFSSNAKKIFDKMTPEETKQWHTIRNRNKYSPFKCSSDDGRIIHDSGWERSFYHLLNTFQIQFLYTHTHDMGFRLANGHFWFPDFVLEEQHSIIDVKGFFRATERFNDKIIPYLTDELKQYSILTYERNPDLKTYLNFEALLADCNTHHIGSMSK